MLRPPPAIPGHLARQILFEGRAGGLPGHLPCQAAADQRARESQESAGGCAAGGVRRAGDGGHQCAPNHEAVAGPAARGCRRQSAEGRLRHRQRSGRASVAGKRAELRAPGAAEAHPPLQRHHLRFRAGWGRVWLCDVDSPHFTMKHLYMGCSRATSSELLSVL